MAYCDIQENCKVVLDLKAKNEDLLRIIDEANKIAQTSINAPNKHDDSADAMIYSFIQNYELLRYNIVAKLNEVNKWIM